MHTTCWTRIYPTGQLLDSEFFATVSYVAIQYTYIVSTHTKKLCDAYSVHLLRIEVPLLALLAAPGAVR